MALTLNINNFNSNNVLERLTLTQTALKDATTLFVDNTQGVTDQRWLLIGTLGSPTADLFRVASVTTSNEITLSDALTRDYNEGTPVTVLFGNKLSIYTAPNVNGSIPPVSDFTLLTIAEIDPDQLSTSYTDQVGTSEKWYAYTYYNDIDSSNTQLSDSQFVRDTRTTSYCNVEDIRTEAGFDANNYITDATIDSARTSAQEQVDGALSGLYIVPFTSPINALIADITKKIAAGNLLKSYATSGFMRDQGQGKIDEAMKMLDKINDRSTVLTGNVTPVSSSDGGGASIVSGGFNGWPNSSTASATIENAGGEHRFRSMDIY